MQLGEHATIQVFNYKSMQACKYKGMSWLDSTVLDLTCSGLIWCSLIVLSRLDLSQLDLSCLDLTFLNCPVPTGPVPTWPVLTGPFPTLPFLSLPDLTWSVLTWPLPLAVGRYGDWMKYLPTAKLSSSRGYSLMRATRQNWSSLLHKSQYRVAHISD